MTMGVPSSVSVDLVRRNKMGANKRRTRPKAVTEEKSLTPSSFTFTSTDFFVKFLLQAEISKSVTALRQNAKSHHGSCRRNFSSP